jgi:hypothetical protein
MKTIRPESVLILTMACLLLAATPGLADKKKQADAGSDESKPATTVATTAKATTATTTAKDTTMTLKGGQEGTTFKSLRIEGEDRVRVEFDRPPLGLDMDPRDAPGLEWEGIHSALERHGLDLVSPYLSRSATKRPPLYARPWLDKFATGGVARFRPNVDGVKRWKLAIANSRGQTVASFEGEGKPPKEITWNGLSTDGTPAPPGLVYSYVLEAYDRAGNKRNFVGEGFELPSYRLATKQGLMMLFAGDELDHSTETMERTQSPPPTVLLEASSWINQRGQADEVVRIEVTARTYEQAKQMVDEVAGQMTPLLLGDPARVQPVTNIDAHAPARGNVAIVVSPAR